MTPISIFVGLPTHGRPARAVILCLERAEVPFSLHLLEQMFQTKEGAPILVSPSTLPELGS